MHVGLHVPTNFQMYRQNSEKTLWGGGGIAPLAPPPPPLATLVWQNIKEINVCEQAERASLKNFRISHHKLLFLSIFCVNVRSS